MDWEKEGFARGISGKNVRALWMRRRPIPARRSFEATIFQFFYSLLPLKKLKKKREEWFQWAESRATEKKTERSRTGFIRLEELMMSSPLDEPRRGVSNLASYLPVLQSLGFVAKPSFLDLASLRSGLLE
ncbi:hypothetical protein CDL15_Pgr023512 [Punica granatum]|uniref:Uncharacterized protein n=1 Tax=Punica granatum TaxID=22663 RepID=A0A218W6P7_PUNGR|nr:hypothetical protein CDL15_Pgr023512 [Punica granatum]